MAKKMFKKNCDQSNDERIEKIEKKLRSLYFLFFGFLFGHFLGPLLT